MEESEKAYKESRMQDSIDSLVKIIERIREKREEKRNL